MKKVISFILIFFTLAACETPAIQFPTQAKTAVPTTTATLVSPSTLASALLLKIMMTGGLCPYGNCQVELILDSEGAYTLREGDTLTQHGIINQVGISKLTKYIDMANFNEIKSQPFTDICPTAYDGQEMTYTFYTLQGVEIISSCKVVIDAHDPLFQLIETFWQEILSKR